jgi:hypothetical protein
MKKEIKTEREFSGEQEWERLRIKRGGVQKRVCQI